MKAYEKWAKQNVYDRTETEKAWKAALKWVKDDCIYIEEDGHKCISQGMIDEELWAGYVVDEELNAKT